MKFNILTILFLCIIFTWCDGLFNCGENAVLSLCKWEKDPTCDEPKGISGDVSKCRLGCQCKPQYVRVSTTDTTCISQNLCPGKTNQEMQEPSPAKALLDGVLGLGRCGPLQKYTDCRWFAEPNCEDTKGVFYPTDTCQPGCKCINGFVRRSPFNDTCVYMPTCPQFAAINTNPLLIGSCDRYDHMATPCKYLRDPTCADPKGETSDRCEPGCMCLDGFVKRSEDDDTCVSKDRDCPRYEGSTDVIGSECGENTRPTGCRWFREPNCDDTKGISSIHCENGCKCNHGLIRKSRYDYTCVLPTECPKKK